MLHSLLELAPHFEGFIAELFEITGAVSQLQRRHQDLAAIHEVKRTFVQRRAVKNKTAEDAAKVDGPSIAAKLAEAFTEPLNEINFARHVSNWLESEKKHSGELALAADYALWATLSAAGRDKHSSGTLFKAPRKIDRANLVPLHKVSRGEICVLQGPEEEQRVRDGFKLTDAGATFEQALDHANYCIWCHKQGKDSCSKGLRDRKTSLYQEDAFGTKLVGCPLEERISEMNLAWSRGYALCALAIVMIDNPTVRRDGSSNLQRLYEGMHLSEAGAGQHPARSRRASSKNVLALPWGFEIYSLLSRWNPLNLDRPLPRPASGRKVLVAGLGPAGFTLAHHLLNDGHTVVGIDGLKIEPLAAGLSGIDVCGRRYPFDPDPRRRRPQ